MLGKFFGRKKDKEGEEAPPSLGFGAKLAKNVVLNQAKKAMLNSHKEGRLVFNPDGSVEYTYKTGEQSTLDLASLSEIFWDLLDAELVGSTMGYGGFAVLGIGVEDIERLLSEVKKEVKK